MHTTGFRRRGLAGLLALVLVLPVSVVGVPAHAAPGPAAYPEFWFDQWGIVKLWAAGRRGGGITVAVVDTGVQASVPELTGSVLPGTDLTGLGGDGRIDRSVSAFSHGTAMASLIVAQGGSGNVNGVAPDAKILPIAVPLGETDNTRPEADETPDAIRFATDHGARIISMSFGAERSPKQSPLPCPAATQAAVFYALAHNVILVASSGNSGDTGSPVEDPSVCLGVLSVGAVDARDQHAVFSSVHPYLTVSAPGVGITTLSKAGDVFVGSGTSQAAALAAGALALIWSAHPQERNRAILARLMAGVRDVGPKGRDPDFGYGIIDADASVNATPAASTPNPVFTGADPFLRQLAAAPLTLTPPPPAPAEQPAQPFSRRAPVTGFDRLTIVAAVVAVGALLVLILLLAFGWRSRRRRRRSVPPGGYPPTGYPPTGYPPTGYPPTGYPPTGYPFGYPPGSYPTV